MHSHHPPFQQMIECYRIHVNEKTEKWNKSLLKYIQLYRYEANLWTLGLRKESDMGSTITVILWIAANVLLMASSGVLAAMTTLKRQSKWQ